MTRQAANRKLNVLLANLILNNPDLRFSQILLTYAFVKQERPAKPEARISWQDEFYVESEVILKRVKERLEE